MHVSNQVVVRSDADVALSPTNARSRCTCAILGRNDTCGFPRVAHWTSVSVVTAAGISGCNWGEDGQYLDVGEAVSQSLRKSSHSPD